LESNQENTLNVTPGVTIPLMIGGNISLAAPMSWLETDNAFATLNPAYTAAPQARLSLPLLRGFGVDANAQGIRVAFYESQATQARTKLEVIRVLADAGRAYWRLYAAARDAAVRRQQHELSVVQLNRARHMVEIGMAAEVDVVRAESAVADTVEAVINAENLTRDRQRALKRLLNQP